MKNQVTVTVFIPWIDTIDENLYKSIYRTFSEISDDDGSMSQAEATHMLSAMSGRTSVYSYESEPSQVNFGSYANLSQYVPNKKLDVQISKTGDHIQTQPKDDVNYYNAVLVECENGKMSKQTVGHLDAIGADIVDGIVLQNAQMKQKMSHLKSVALNAIAALTSRAPVLNAEIIGTKDTRRDFSL